MTTDPTHSFDNPQRGVVVAYNRDRGDPDTDAVEGTQDDVFNAFDHQYAYLFWNEMWHVRRKGEWIPLNRYRDSTGQWYDNPVE